MILEPEHDKEEPSALGSFTPEVEEETGARKTETEAAKSTWKRREESLSWRYTREELVELEGKEKVSSYRQLSFPIRNKEICTYELVQRGFGDTSTGRESLNSGRWKMALKDGGGEDQEWENGLNRNRKQKDYRQQEQGTLQGWRRYGSGWRQLRLGFDRSHQHRGPKKGGLWSWY